MAAVGVDVVVAVEGRRGCARSPSAPEDVARGQRLGHGHDVGLDAPVVDAEPLPVRPNRDHLVGDEHDVVARADLAHALEVAARRDLDAVGLRDRLDDERGDELGPLVEDLLLEQLGARGAQRRARSRGHAVGGRRGCGEKPGTPGSIGRRTPSQSLAAVAPPAGAVVVVPARDHLVGARLHPAPGGRSGRAERRLVGLRAAADEDGRRQVAGRQRCDPLGQLDRDVGLRVRGAAVVQPAELLVPRRAIRSSP